MRSLALGGDQNYQELESNRITVGTQLPYARWMQEGTGIYGPKGQPIVPTQGQVLSFVINGRRYFVRSIKGSQPRPFLFIDQPLIEVLNNLARKYFFLGQEETDEE